MKNLSLKIWKFIARLFKWKNAAKWLDKQKPKQEQDTNLKDFFKRMDKPFKLKHNKKQTNDKNLQNSEKNH